MDQLEARIRKAQEELAAANTQQQQAAAYFHNLLRQAAQDTTLRHLADITGLSFQRIHQLIQASKD